MTEEALAECEIEESLETPDTLAGVIALVNGVALTQLPEDLYIPPDALEVFLEAFEGPLDLLLYLIRRQNLDILNIPIAEITRQYMDYVDLMKELRLELAADYLVMAAMLAEIKSRMLLPQTESEKEEEDPRAQLVRRLQEYERFKTAAERLDALPRQDREFITGHVELQTVETPITAPEISLSELVAAFLDVLKRSDLIATHKVHKEALSVRERMSKILAMINEKKYALFQDCFDLSEGKMGIVVSFLAILEMLRLGYIDVVQTEAYGPIHLRVIQDE